MEFTLEIEMGNEAMKEPQDVADALRELAEQELPYWDSSGGGIIRDENGNTVGEFRFTV